jgi:hypothetical protein
MTEVESLKAWKKRVFTPDQLKRYRSHYVKLHMRMLRWLKKEYTPHRHD